MTKPGPVTRIAYLVAIFPHNSLSFINREIVELINRGIDVRIFAIKRPENRDREDILCSQDIKSRVTYARPDNLAYYLFRNSFALLRHPIRYTKSLMPFIWIRKNSAILQINRALKLGETFQLFKSLYHFIWGVGISDALRKAGISHVHAHFTSGCDAALAVHNYAQIPFSFTAHASGDIYVNPFLMQEKMKAAKFIVAACDYNRKYLNHLADYLYEDKIKTIYNGISPNEIILYKDSPESRLGLERQASQRVHIVSIGRLLDPKGFITLIDSCHILKNRGVSFHCQIIGTGPQKELIEQRIAKFSLEDSMSVKEYMNLEDVYKELSRADIFVLLSQIGAGGFRDGFPTVITEAMHCSVPVVSTWISAIPEMVINGKTGLLVPERDALAAADALERLINDQDLRMNYGSAGKQRAMERFNLDINIEQYLRLLQ
jgi:colanic acid/amylovoran biosynthesis glycosyltransferase